MIQKIITTVLVAIIGFAYLAWDAQGATRNIEEILAKELELIEGRCSQPEAINRHLLQQSWFYDESYTQLAGAFGQSSFGLYKKDTPEIEEINGAFCIDENRLEVRYFNRRFVPMKIDFSELSVQLGTKIDALEEDTYTLIELNRKRMVLEFSSDGNQHVFYRKN